jgi:hypothetical protein
MVHRGFYRPPGVMDDVLHDPANITITFGKVKRSESCRSLVVVSMGLELKAQRYMAEGRSE